MSSQRKNANVKIKALSSEALALLKYENSSDTRGYNVLKPVKQ